jgi:hypothetical protein
MDMEKAKALVHLIHWMITDGQAHAPSLLYVPLPEEVQEIGKQGLAKVKFEGQQLFAYDGSGIISTKSTDVKKSDDTKSKDIKKSTDTMKSKDAKKSKESMYKSCEKYKDKPTFYKACTKAVDKKMAKK